MRYPVLSLLLLTLLATSVRANDIDGRIYGRVTTTDGEVFEGIIRWDRNEVSWVDVLNGSKVRYANRNQTISRSSGRRIEIFGVTVYEGDDNSLGSRTSGIRFGHIRVIEPKNSSSAILVLQSGEEIEFRNGSTDIGSNIREIIVEDAERGEVELRWRDIERIEFFQAPEDATSNYGYRLYGTLTTRAGHEFQGFICWDVDEALSTDVLDGNDESGRRHKIRFDNIDRIQRFSASSASVLLRNGEEFILRGTNDVNDSNSGILVLDPSMGQVEVGWNDLEEVVFSEPEYVPTYADFENDGRLYGTVYSRDGETFEGAIVWDNDEAYAWELLDGEMDDLEFDIEFGEIRSIERISSRGAEVTLLNGRTFELRNSNDVDDENDGIYIIDNDDNEVGISWREFDRVVFEKP